MPSSKPAETPCLNCGHDDYCGEPDPRDMYVCTRKRGHSGDHAACSELGHTVVTWKPGEGKKKK